MGHWVVWVDVRLQRVVGVVFGAEAAVYGLAKAGLLFVEWNGLT